VSDLEWLPADRFVDNEMTSSEYRSRFAVAGDVPALGECASSNGDSASSQSVAHFVRTLFRLLDESAVRYCVLHGWDELPDHLSSDLDLAVHSQDKPAIPAILESLRQRGYTPYQWKNYVTKGHSFYFYWTTASATHTVAVDLIFAHRRAGMILATGEKLVSSRMRHSGFWIAAPDIEYSYLLGKKAAKGKASLSQSLRLKQLVQTLGREKAAEIAGEIFQPDVQARIVDACAQGSIDAELRTLTKKSWRASPSSDAFSWIRYWAGEFRRAIWRASEPAGVLLAVMGPDGAGKSTIIEGLAQEFVIPLRRRILFHWRPQLLARRKDSGPVTEPHGQSPRGPLASMAHLSAFFADCWAGYLFVIWARLVRSDFVQFDRYFHDVLVDPLRYRYGGPAWYAALLCRLLPEPDLVIVLDASDHLFFARKTELSRAEIQRQRVAYRELRFKRARVVYVATDAGVQPTLLASSIALVDFMQRRFDRRFARWMKVA
jgi:thymidylate kinase